MANQKIPPLDLMFFLTESPQSPKHVGAVQVFEMPANAPADYLTKLVAAFKDAPVASPFNRKPVFPRFGMPEWEEVRDIETNYHVRHSALPRPGNTSQLMEVVQRLHAGMLDRRRPGWICQVIEGLEGNRFAIYSKIQHAYIDGMSGVKRMYGSLSSSPSDQRITPPWSYDPAQAAAAADHSRRDKPAKKGSPGLITQLKGVAEATEILSKMGLQLLRLRNSEGQVPFMATRNRLNRPIEWDSRCAAVCTLPLDRVKAVGRQQGCTVNEVVLAVIGAALDDYLTSLQEAGSAPLVALCPMSIRAAGDDSASTQVSAVHVRLGEPGADITDRLRQVIDSSHASKEEVSGVSAAAMIDYGVFIFGLWELIERSGAGRYITPSYNVLVSNVPGPGDKGLYLNGARMVASYPISTLLPGVNLNATLLSHGNSLDFGLLGDSHALPDVEQVVDSMVAHFEELATRLLVKKRTTAKRPAGKNKPAARQQARAKATPKTATKTKTTTRRKTATKVKPRRTASTR
jgi:diacylglycerol O-acyltransferase